VTAPNKKKALTIALSKRPMLDATEWDFRWVRNKAEALAVYRYELGREILREVRYILKSDKSYAELLEYIREESLPGYTFPTLYDAADDHELGDDIYYLTKISRGMELIGGLPPHSLLVINNIRKNLLNKKTQERLLIRKQLPGEIDAFDAEYGPETVMELIFSNINYPTKKEIKTFLNEWVDSFEYFTNNKSGRPVNPLIKLAAYRFAQRPPQGSNIQHEFDKQLKSESKFERSSYGNSLYKKYLNKDAVSQSSWSEDINFINKILVRKARILSRI